MLQLNIMSLTALTRLLLPEMAARGGGRIMNIASTAAFQPGPLMAAYFASKAYVLSFSQAVANEAADSGVSITCLCPGPAATGFIESAQIGSPRIFKTNILDSSRVAREGYRAMMRGKTGRGRRQNQQDSRPRRTSRAAEFDDARAPFSANRP